jgi:hypothetical protein
LFFPHATCADAVSAGTTSANAPMSAAAASRFDGRKIALNMLTSYP